MTPQTLSYIGFVFLIAVIIRRMMQRRNIAQYSPSQLEAMLKQAAGMILLDVRTKSERSAQHIAGSIHIPLQELAIRIEELKKFAGREIICYCQSGSRSMSAAALLQKKGLDAANLRGGIAEWNFYKLGNT
ncbi:MAG: rhodanese-like domain-containing protein [Ignavibacteriales bacterium]|nr:rhodanese-like domain-containing protein [Ignavibacteriales bacterium]